MKRPTIVAFAVIFAVLVTTAVPVSAAPDNTASMHTTDSDFNSADTLDSVEVVGSGATADVEFAPHTIDDFEDADTSDTKSSNWGSWSSPSSGSWTPDDSDPINDSWSGQLSMPAGSNSFVQTQRSSATTRNLTFAVRVDNQTGQAADAVQIKVVSSNGLLFTISFDQDGSISDSDSNAYGSWSEGDVNVVQVEWDFASDEATVTTNGQSNTVTFTNSASNYNELEVHNDNSDASSTTVDALVDDIETIPDTDTGTYISQTHDADLVEQAFTNLSLTNVEATVAWQQWDGSQWVTVDQSQYTTDGNKTVSWSTQDTSKWRVNVTFNRSHSFNYVGQLHDEGVQFEATAPTLDNSSASPNGTDLTDREVTLEIDVNDSDFRHAQGDEVTVTFQTQSPDESSFTQEGTDTLTSNGTAELTTTFDEGGEWKWKVEIEDTYGVQGHDSREATFTVPSTLEIRNETPQHGKVDNADVEIIFYEDEEESPTIVNKTVSNGEVDLSGLPVGSQFSVHLETSQHHTRTVLIDSIYDQDTIFLLQTSTTSVEQTFDLKDQTGNFPAEDTDIKIQRAINDSLYDTNGDDFNWTTVSGDELSASGTFTADLEQDTRYRIVVENDQNDTRILGAHTATSDGATVTLTIGEVVEVPVDAQTHYRYNATYTNSTTGQNVISFEYNDTKDNTDAVHVKIYEYRNESNVLQSNTTHNGPLGSFAITQNVPPDEEDVMWVVEATIERDGEIRVVRTIVGPRDSVLPGLPNWLVTIISLGSIWLVAGLFSQVNGEVGGLVVAGMGGMYWYVDFLPDGVDTGVVVLALLLAGVIFINARRQGGGF